MTNSTRLNDNAFRDGIAILEAATGRKIKQDHLPVWHESFSECSDEDFINGCKLFARHIGGWLEIKSVWEGVTMYRDRPRPRHTAAQKAYFEKRRREISDASAD